jgi:hypothetical protein
MGSSLFNNMNSHLNRVLAFFGYTSRFRMSTLTLFAIMVTGITIERASAGGEFISLVGIVEEVTPPQEKVGKHHKREILNGEISFVNDYRTISFSPAEDATYEITSTIRPGMRVKIEDFIYPGGQNLSIKVLDALAPSTMATPNTTATPSATTTPSASARP